MIACHAKGLRGEGAQLPCWQAVASIVKMLKARLTEEIRAEALAAAAH